MHYLADTDTLTRDGIITADQAKEIELRSRSAMVALVINTVLCAGILAATFGLIVLLADPAAVAVFGTFALALGLIILLASGPLYRIFGNATSLIGAGLLLAGAAFELVGNFPGSAGTIMAVGGAIVALLALAGFLLGPTRTRFALGAVFLMGGALHLNGIFFGLDYSQTTGWVPVAANLWAFALLVAAGVILDIRLLSALAIVPFAGLLSTQTFYDSATYAFYSPEPTLTILQMGALVLAALALQRVTSARIGRQMGTLAVMAFIVGNLAFLVASLFGDTVGSTLWAPVLEGADWEKQQAAHAAWEQTALTIPADVFAVIWALLLTGAAIWAAFGNRRAMFNGALTFAAIHAYTQFFENFGLVPLAWVIGGLAAIPLAWGIWRLNDWLRKTSGAATDVQPASGAPPAA
jgi:hypothetical protein